MAATYAFNKFNNFTYACGSKLHNLGADTFYVQLSNNAPVATSSVETDLAADLSTGGGYTAGGVSVGAGTLSTSSGVAKLVLTDKVITASGANIGPFRYVILLNNTATNKDLVGWYDYTAATTILDGDTFTLDFDGTAGILTL